MNREKTWEKLVEFGVVEGEIRKDQWYLVKDNLRGADLSGADLNEANLFRANLFAVNLSDTDLSGANLIGANLMSANLKSANLRKADFSGADLTWADLSMANLSDADLSGASMVNANFTDSTLSGVCLHKAHMAGWKIENVTCTHIREFDENKDNYRIIEFESPDEFAKRFSVYENVIEMILDIPYSFLTRDIGDMIAQAFNYMAGSEVLSGKGVESLSDDGATLYKFLVRNSDMLSQIHERINNMPEELNRGLKPELENIQQEIIATREDLHRKEDETMDMLEDLIGLKLEDINLLPGISYPLKKVNDKVYDMAVNARRNRIGRIVFSVVENCFK